MDAMTASAILADHLTARGLSVTKADDGTLNVTNPLHGLVGETVAPGGDCYLTGYGYEIGQHGDEPATADRVAYLLGLPAQRQAVTR
ncbi:hypothetical protein [Streptomyces sp. 049-1]|uniref:hypothetical protein n=1 Tax=Streptomyces sp. 049-1 TaxID=2789264 RepID=UPI00398090B3